MTSILPGEVFAAAMGLLRGAERRAG